MSVKLRGFCLENNKPVIELKNVDLGYRGRPVLRRLNFSVFRGDSLGIVGPNGSGKTTFLRSILGLVEPDSGTVWTDPKLRFAYVPQIDTVNLRLPLTVRETVELALRGRRPFGKLTNEEIKHVDQSILRVGIRNIQDQVLSECSGGQRQKTIVAQALSQKPDVLLLDEPTKGLDVAAESDLLSLIEELKREENLTILFVTHVLHVPLNFTQKVLVLSQGVGILSTPEELVHTKRLEEIYGVPFILAESGGVRWATPLKGRS